MDRVLAGAVGLALTGAIFQSLLGPDSFPVALGRSNWLLVGMLVVGTVLTWLFVRSAPATPGDPALTGSPPPEQLAHHQHHRRFHL
jgi:hypothetical protein